MDEWEVDEPDLGVQRVQRADWDTERGRGDGSEEDVFGAVKTAVILTGENRENRDKSQRFWVRSPFPLFPPVKNSRHLERFGLVQGEQVD